MTRRRNSQQTKEPEVLLSATDLINMDISKMSGLEFRITTIKLLSVLEKSIKDPRESLSAEIKSNQAKIKNALNEMQSKMDALTLRANDAEERVSDIEDKMVEKEEAEEKREKQFMDHEGRL